MASSSSPSAKPAATVSYFLRLIAPPALRSESRIRATNTNLGSYGTHDANLAFTGYGLLFVSEVLKRVATAATTTVASASSTTDSAVSTTSKTNPAIGLLAKLLFARNALTGSPIVSPATVADVATRTRTFSSLISDIRIFNRLWGWFLSRCGPLTQLPRRPVILCFVLWPISRLLPTYCISHLRMWHTLQCTESLAEFLMTPR